MPVTNTDTLLITLPHRPDVKLCTAVSLVYCQVNHFISDLLQIATVYFQSHLINSERDTEGEWAQLLAAVRRAVSAVWLCDYWQTQSWRDYQQSHNTRPAAEQSSVTTNCWLSRRDQWTAALPGLAESLGGGMN